MARQKSALKRKDALLLIMIIVGAAIVGTVMWFMRNSDKPEQVTVKVDGNVVYSESLSKDIEYKVDGYDGGYNIVVVQDSKVSVKEADCPDKVCMNSGQISKSGDTIVCMPHKVVVEIEGGEGTVDSVAK